MSYDSSIPADCEPRDVDVVRFADWQKDNRSEAIKTLDMAKALISGDRHDQHGDVKACHTAIARLWTAFLGVQVKPREVALMLALMKIARTQTGNGNGDNYVDGSAYIALAGELSNGDAGC